MNTRCAVICPIATGGGVSESFLTCLDMLRDNGVTPIAIVPRGFHFLKRLGERGYETHEVDRLEQGGLINLFGQSLALVKAIRKSGAELAVLNNGRHVRWVKMLLPNLPLVAIYHGGKVSRLLKADRIITINDDQLQYLQDAGYPEHKAVVVDNALPLESLPQYKRREKWNGLPVIGTLRLLEPAKGVDTLIDAIGILAKRGLRLKTRIGSNGSQKQALMDQVARLAIGDLVHFDGWVSDKDAFYDQLNIYVLPSKAEEWGIGIVEANAARLPVIATRTLGPKRIVKHEQTGLLVDVDDPDSMADAIERLVENPQLAETLARNGYEHCRDNYLFPTVAPLMTKEILNVLKTV